jgi:hypothetical protein
VLIPFIDSSGKEEIMSGKGAIVREAVGATAKIRDETTASVRLAQRSRIILLAFERRLNEEIADEVS